LKKTRTKCRSCCRVKGYFNKFHYAARRSDFSGACGLLLSDSNVADWVIAAFLVRGWWVFLLDSYFLRFSFEAG